MEENQTELPSVTPRPSLTFMQAMYLRMRSLAYGMGLMSTQRHRRFFNSYFYEKTTLKQPAFMEKQPIIIHNHYYHGTNTNVMGETHISGGTQILGNNDTKGDFIAGNVIYETTEKKSANTFEPESETTYKTEIPIELTTPEAETFFDRLKKGGFLDDNLQPTWLSLGQKGVLASELSARLRLKRCWKTFGSLWKINSETLRGAYNLALNRAATGDFLDTLKQILFLSFIIYL